MMDRIPIRQPVTILIVSADRQGAAAVATHFREHGFTAGVAVDADEALGLVAASPPDVILYDCDSADDGSDPFIHQVRDQAGLKRPFLVALGDPTRCDAAADLCLMRPIEPAVLIGVVKRFRRALAADPLACG